MKSIVCPDCGERNNPAFIKCWKCSALIQSQEALALHLPKSKNRAAGIGALLLACLFNYFSYPLWSVLLQKLKLMPNRPISGLAGPYIPISFLALPLLYVASDRWIRYLNPRQRVWVWIIFLLFYIALPVVAVYSDRIMR